jgi:hypothetical protein
MRELFRGSTKRDCNQEPALSISIDYTRNLALMLIVSKELFDGLNNYLIQKLSYSSLLLAVYVLEYCLF